MLACSGRRDSGPAAAACCSLSLSKTCVASSSSSQSMLSLAPFGDVGAAAGTLPVDGVLEMAAGPGRVLAGGGTWLCGFCMALGACEADPSVELSVGLTAGMFDWLGELLVGPCTAWRFGNEPRPGGGGGLEAVGGGADGWTARIEPDCGADEGSGGGCETRPDGGPAGGDADMGGADMGGAGGIAGRLPPLGGCAGPGIPISVFFMSPWACGDATEAEATGAG
jgi:hypothetical protein